VKAFIPVIRPFLDNAEILAAQRVISTGWISQGPEVALFEKEFADYVGARYACAVSNCTTALHMSLVALGVGPGDEVIVPSHTFIATVNSILYCGAIPVLVDIKKGSFNLDPVKIENAVSPRTKAILCVHQIGVPCDIFAITSIARKYKLRVIEDAACAIGSEVFWNGKWQKIGKPHGDVACFSFHPRKLLTTGEGGMITTSSKSLDKKFRLLRQHGMSISDAARHGSGKVLFEKYVILGYNYRLTDIQAGIGREQLKKLPILIKKRRAQALAYNKLLSGICGLGLPVEEQWMRSNYQSYCVRLPEGCDQRKVMQYMLEKGIALRRGIMCVHLEPVYRNNYLRRNRKLDLRESESARDGSVILPLYHGMTDAEQNKVVIEFAKACRKYNRNTK
jgi:perosamine synthetase